MDLGWRTGGKNGRASGSEGGEGGGFDLSEESFGVSSCTETMK